MSQAAQEKKSMGYVFTIGLFGGLFASALTYVVHFLNFIPYGPGVLLQLWTAYDYTPWLRGPLGHVLGIMLISVLSMVAAFVYYLLFRRMETPWLGIWFGLALWVVIFLGVNQMIPGVKQIGELGWTTNIIFVCIFIIYGLFVGYSISYEYNQERVKEEQKKRNDESELKGE